MGPEGPRVHLCLVTDSACQHLHAIVLACMLWSNRSLPAAVPNVEYGLRPAVESERSP